MPMHVVLVLCAACGSVELTPDEITVRVCWENNQGTFGFSCPLCGVVNIKHAEPRVVDLLVSGGAQLVMWHLPIVLVEHGSGDVLTEDELDNAIIDIHILPDEDLFEQIAGPPA
jgi:hypothetical protein